LDPKIPKKFLNLMDSSEEEFSEIAYFSGLYVLPILLKLNFIPESPIIEFLGGETPSKVTFFERLCDSF
jgi:hypothetical protein